MINLAKLQALLPILHPPQIPTPYQPRLWSWRGVFCSLHETLRNLTERQPHLKLKPPFLTTYLFYHFHVIGRGLQSAV